MSNTPELDKEIEALLTKGEAKQLDTKLIHITSPQICKSQAGYYVGQWCVEWIHNSWVPQPYDRLSGYGTREQMLQELPHHH